MSEQQDNANVTQQTDDLTGVEVTVELTPDEISSILLGAALHKTGIQPSAGSSYTVTWTLPNTMVQGANGRVSFKLEPPKPIQTLQFPDAGFSFGGMPFGNSFDR